MKYTIIGLVLIISLCAGCVSSPVHNPIDPIPATTPDENQAFPEVVYPPELNELIEFLAEDTTNEKPYYNDPAKGVHYYVCCGFTRDLARNASKHGIALGGVSLRETPTVGAMTRYYHSMNYAIVDNKFVIISPMDDEIYWLDYVENPNDTILHYFSIHHFNNGRYRYITIFPDAQMMVNYGKHRETIDIDLRGEIDEEQLILDFPPE